MYLSSIMITHENGVCQKTASSEFLCLFIFFQVDDAVLRVSLPYKEYFLFAEVIKVIFNFTVVALLFGYTLCLILPDH